MIMVSDVTLKYDTTFLGAGVQSCSGISTPFNATIQDIMNVASLYGGADCSNHNPFAYTAKYFEGLGNFLEHLIIDGLEWVPHTLNYNTSNEYWQLSVNGVEAKSGMSTTPVASKDLIEWKFVKANP